jgi:hypothetical protein
MLDTGFPRADVENDFLRARRQQVLAALARRLLRRPHDSGRLLTLDEVTGALGMRGERYLGLQTIRLAAIVGTIDSRRDFDRRFRPTSNRVRSRWEQLALAQRRGAPIPPIEVYRVGDLHFVSDGHHRVSIAAATGQQTIDAYVTEVLTTVPPTSTTRPVAQPRDRRRRARSFSKSRARPGVAGMRPSRRARSATAARTGGSASTRRPNASDAGLMS